jgi:hypothetical protein
MPYACCPLFRLVPFRVLAAHIPFNLRRKRRKLASLNGGVCAEIALS